MNVHWTAARLIGAGCQGAQLNELWPGPLGRGCCLGTPAAHSWGQQYTKPLLAVLGPELFCVRVHSVRHLKLCGFQSPVRFMQALAVGLALPYGLNWTTAGLGAKDTGQQGSAQASYGSNAGKNCPRMEGCTFLTSQPWSPSEAALPELFPLRLAFPGQGGS